MMTKKRGLFSQIPRYDHCNGKGAKDFGKIIRERKAELEG